MSIYLVLMCIQCMALRTHALWLKDSPVSPNTHRAIRRTLWGVSTKRNFFPEPRHEPGAGLADVGWRSLPTGPALYRRRDVKSQGWTGGHSTARFSEWVSVLHVLTTRVSPSLEIFDEETVAMETANSNGAQLLKESYTSTVHAHSSDPVTTSRASNSRSPWLDEPDEEKDAEWCWKMLRPRQGDADGWVVEWHRACPLCPPRPSASPVSLSPCLPSFKPVITLSSFSTSTTTLSHPFPYDHTESRLIWCLSHTHP